MPLISRRESSATKFNPPEPNADPGVANGWLKRQAASLNDSYRAFEKFMLPIAICGVIGMPMYYLIWMDLFPQPFESLPLRLLGGLLCVAVCTKRFWPAKYRNSIGPVLWYVTIVYCLPFFFTFMLLMNGGSPVWLVTWLCGFILLAMVVEFGSLILLLTVGVVLAIAAYALCGGSLSALAPLIEQVPVFFFTIVAGVLSVYRQQMARHVLTKARDAAEAANQAKSDFLAMMSHEIRTPMNGVLGMVGVLLETNMSSEQHKCAVTIRESGESLLRIINDVLDFSKLEAECVEMDTTAFDVHALLKYASEIVAPKARTKALHLNVTVSPEVPQYMRSDAGRFRQVVINILGNAIKFTEHGSVSLNASVVTCKAGHKSLRIAVTDSGIGIAEDQLSRLFQKFSQANSTISRRFGGSGLGLAISKKLVERLGGKISVESILGKGSTFWFEVPLVVGTKEEADSANLGAAPQRLDAALASIAALERPLRLLVVEDNATNLVVVTAVLAKHGIKPDVAHNGLEAVEAVRCSRYDVILMDVHMPEMDGLEATRVIRAFGGPASKTPIIALTANSFESDIEKCRSAGMNAHLGKPFRANDLITALGAALRGSDNFAGTSEAEIRSSIKAPIIDLNAIEDFRADSSDQALRRLINSFLIDAAQKLDRLSHIATERTSLAEAVRLAHSLKSSGAMAGAAALSQFAAGMEKALTGEAAQLAFSDIAEMKGLFADYRAQLEVHGLAA